MAPRSLAHRLTMPLPLDCPIPDSWDSYRKHDLNVMARQLYPTRFERLLREDPFKTLRDIDIICMTDDQLVAFHNEACRLLRQR